MIQQILADPLTSIDAVDMGLAITFHVSEQIAWSFILVMIRLGRSKGKQEHVFLREKKD